MKRVVSRFPRPRYLMLCALAGVLLCTAGARAQETDPNELLKDFIYYCNVARPDLAAATAEALLDSGLSDSELAELLDEGASSPERFDRALSRAIRVPELESIAGQLATRIEQGRLDLSRDEDRILEAIEMLTGTVRGQRLAEQRLMAAGEFAVPHLLRVVVEGKEQQAKFAAERMLLKIKRLSVAPLVAALPELGDPVSQRIVIDLLGEIGWPHAAPMLLEVSLDQSRPENVREAAARAYQAVGGVERDISRAYSTLGMQYFRGDESLIAYPYDELNNVWAYDPITGLSAQPVATEIYHEIMAMKQATRATDFDPANKDAISLFVASDLKRENDLPDGMSDPVYGDLQYSPSFYATVFGTQTCLDVLAMALDIKDTALVRDAIAALDKTTGGSNLFSRGTGRQPLLESLQYPDRRVQYESALVLGGALPEEKFSGDFNVVPLLASAVRTGNRSFAVVLADDQEDQRVNSSRLNAIGFDVVGAGGSMEELIASIRDAVAVDLILVQKRTTAEAEKVVDDLRVVPKTSVAPVLILAEAVDMPELKRAFYQDGRINVSRSYLAEDAFSASVDAVMTQAAGGRMEDWEAEQYAILALETLEDIAISDTPAYDVNDATSALLEALEARTGGARLLVADVLTLIDSDQAQRELFDAALQASGTEQIDLLARVADSVKRFGDYAEERHVGALLRLVRDSDGELAEAAARVHGALNLPPSNAVELLPE